MTRSEFANASIVGTYAAMVSGLEGTAPFAAVGLLTFDAAGTVTGFFRENRVGARFGNRVIVDLAYRGTYTIQTNGIGTTASNETGQSDWMFAIRQAELSGTAPRAQELAIVFRELDDSSGSLKTAVATRLPEGAVFGQGSLDGCYVGFANSRGGQTPAAGCGVLVYDGHGGFSESNFANVQGHSFRERRFVNGSDNGVYTVLENGIGTVANGGVVFVITRARQIDAFAVAEEYAFFVRDLVPGTGSLFTGTTKRISD